MPAHLQCFLHSSFQLYILQGHLLMEVHNVRAHLVGDAQQLLLGLPYTHHEVGPACLQRLAQLLYTLPIIIKPQE